MRDDGAEADEPLLLRLARIAARHPDRPAFASWRARRSYAELDRGAARISHALLARRGPEPESVAVFLDSDASAAESFLGVLRAGKRFVPIEPRLPDPRVGAIAEDAEASIALSDSRHRDRLARLVPGLPILDVDALPAGTPVEEPTVGPETHAWIGYTSGSTGRPKGVLQTHGNLMAYVRIYADAFRLSPADRLASMFTLAVNGGLHDLLMALGTGACFCGWDPSRDGIAGGAGWLRDERATIYSSVPTVFRRLAESLEPEARFPDVRLVRLWGEASYRRDFEAFRRHFSDACRLVNRLGSSETGPLRWIFLSPAAEVPANSLPVGWDAPGVRTELVDDAGCPVPSGDIGEVVARSRFLSPGYWRRPAETAAAFSEVPGARGERIYRTGDLGRLLPDGNCVPMGRKDSQVKVRGHRVELDEIEQALLRHPGVREAVVVGARDTDDQVRLVAYVALRDGAPPSVTSLRQCVAARLPAVMVPGAFVTLDALPQAQNGKVNRRALPAPGTARPALDAPYRAPADDLEWSIAAVWREVLSLDAVGVDDPFLDLGGDSLRAMSVAARLQSALGVRLPMAALLDAPTVADLARAIRRRT